MQFEKTKMVYFGGEKDKNSDLELFNRYQSILPEGTPVLSCHIQEGEDLSEHSVDHSMQMASAFFEQYFPEYKWKAYVCYTWLLYPKMVMHLKEHSKILKFAKRFEVLCSFDNSQLAMRTLFPTNADYTRNDLTSLQKMAIEHKDWFGFSCGVILRESRL